MILVAKPSPMASIVDACAEAVQLANYLQLGVEFPYGAVTLTAYPGNVPTDLVEEYHVRTAAIRGGR